MPHLLGVIARSNEVLRSIVIHGIPLDVGLLVFLAMGGLFACAAVNLGGTQQSWAALILCVFFFALFLIARLKHNIIFKATQVFDEQSELDRSASGDDHPFFVSGRFLLVIDTAKRWERTLDWLMTGTHGDRWFVELPAEFVAPDHRSFSFGLNFDPSERFLGLPLENKGGLWTIDGLFEHLERPELGHIYRGFARRRAVRLRFRTPKGQRRKVVISFETEDAQRSFLAILRRSAQANWVGLA